MRALATVIAAFGITTAFAVAMTAVIGATAVGVLSVDLPDPKRLDTLTFDQPTVVLDRTGKVELTRFQRVQRRVVTFAEVPPTGPRLGHDGGGPDVLDERRLRRHGDPVGDRRGRQRRRCERGASTITQQLVRARLLPDARQDRTLTATCARPRSSSRPCT